MPRQSRIDAPGALHHIIARGIGRRNIFNDDQDRDNFVKRLQMVLEQTRTGCYAWALIPGFRESSAMRCAMRVKSAICCTSLANNWKNPESSTAW